MAFKTTIAHREGQRRFTEAHPEYRREWFQVVGKYYQAEERNRDKIEALTHYGKAKCACVMCGEARLACLSIDHINGNGGQQRRKDGLVGQKLYRRLRIDGYPKGYQTLCMNCQFCKAVLDRAYNKRYERV